MAIAHEHPQIGGRGLRARAVVDSDREVAAKLERNVVPLVVGQRAPEAVVAVGDVRRALRQRRPGGGRERIRRRIHLPPIRLKEPPVPHAAGHDDSVGNRVVIAGRVKARRRRRTEALLRPEAGRSVPDVKARVPGARVRGTLVLLQACDEVHELAVSIADRERTAAVGRRLAERRAHDERAGGAVPLEHRRVGRIRSPTGTSDSESRSSG